MAKSKFEILDHENYLAAIKGSVGSKMFRHFYVLDNGKKKDILNSGRHSCARFVSCILKMFDLISETHATVNGVVADMRGSGWKETGKLVPGNVLVWEEKSGRGGELHTHIGFYIGKEKAISNFEKNNLPAVHHFTYHNKRKIITILTRDITK